MRAISLLLCLLPSLSFAEVPKPFPIYGVVPGMTLDQAVDARGSAGLDPSVESYEVQTQTGATVELTDIYVGNTIEDGSEGFSLTIQVSPETIGGQVVDVTLEHATVTDPDLNALVAERSAVYGQTTPIDMAGRILATWHVALDGSLFDVFDYRCTSTSIAISGELETLFDQGCAINHSVSVEENNGLFTLREHLAMPAFAFEQSQELIRSLQ